jgi:DNA modification methylase
MSKKHNPYKQGVLSGAVSPKKNETVDAFEEKPDEKVTGPLKGDFVAPPEVVDTDERTGALPEQEDFWRPPVRFGSIPVETVPLGWDRRRGFRKLFPFVSLPTQVVERVSFGHPQLEPNRLFWGDNLHVMRQLPSESIDLIYIDPPFFSGRQYNVIFGDQNELRSFSDIWEGGMPGYLVWLNARLYEMKRLLKKTGSIYVHCDWHASHYIKAELDKIFGYKNFINEIIWHYSSGGASKDRFSRKHDAILWYSKSTQYKFNTDEMRVPYKFQNTKIYEDKDGIYMIEPQTGKRRYYHEKGKVSDDVFDINFVGPHSSERIGYPTQKPLELIQKLLDAASNPGDVVADFFMGGGTWIESSLGIRVRKGENHSLIKEFDAKKVRRFIGCDQSRVAVALTADRITNVIEKQTGSLFQIADFTIEHWGIYEAERLSRMPTDQFRAFISRAFGAVPDSVSPHIHGYKGAIPVWVGEPSQRTSVSAKEVEDFANATRKTIRYQQDNLREGTMLAWAFRPDAVKAAEHLREMENTELNFIRLEQIRIDSPPFREHVAALSTDHADYANFLTFVQPPKVEVGWKRILSRNYRFDVSETAVLNVGAKIINVQWDFDFDKRFSSTPGYSFIRGTKKEPILQVQYEFPRADKFRIACKVQDDMGGEGLWSGEVEVS